MRHGLVLEQCCLLIWVQCRSLRWLKCSQLPFGTPAATWSKPRLRSWNLIQGLLRTQHLCDFVINVIHCNSRRNLQSVCYLKCVLLCLKSVISHYVSLRPLKFPGVFHGNIQQTYFWSFGPLASLSAKISRRNTTQPNLRDLVDWSPPRTKIWNGS